MAKSILGLIKKPVAQFLSIAAKVYYNKIWGMHIGHGVKISRSAKLDTTNPKGVYVGDYTAISFGASVISHDFVNRVHLDTRIGSCCLIGARAIVLAGVTVGDHSIVGAGSVVMQDVPPNSVVTGNPARISERGIITSKWGIREPSFVAANGDDSELRRIQQALRNTNMPNNNSNQGKRYLPALKDILHLTPAENQAPLQSFGFDSFGTVSLRAEIETLYDIVITDEVWMRVKSVSDVIALIPNKDKIIQPNSHASNAKLRREREIGMPQMAMSCLSESWLLKELGDMHWEVLTSSLGVASRNIADEAGDRLYATFTCIKLKFNQSLSHFKENDQLTMDLETTRFGGGLFFSNVAISTTKCSGYAEIMSSFSKFGETGSNTSLVKGQPVIPPDFPVRTISEAPSIVSEYRIARSIDLSEIIFETEYEIIPQHDINGVGLLYFAAYPIINDIAIARFPGAIFSINTSTIER